MFWFYEIDDEYIDYLSEFDSKVFSAKLGNRKFTRKYIGIIFQVHNLQYFIPLSSYKSTYNNISESLCLKKIGKLAVLRINNMIPASLDVVNKIDFRSIADIKYKHLLESEYRIIRKRQKEIRRDALIVYHFRCDESKSDKKLYNLCCDFKLLEEKSLLYNNPSELTAATKELT